MRGQLVLWAPDGVILRRCAGRARNLLPRAAVDAAMWLAPDAGEPPRALRSTGSPVG